MSKPKKVRPRLSDEAREAIRTGIQTEHDYHVWISIRTFVENWKRGNVTDHESRHVAARFDFALESPSFLPKLLAFIEEIRPGSKEEG